MQKIKENPKAFVGELLVGLGGAGLLFLGCWMLVLLYDAPRSYAYLALSQVFLYLAMICFGLISFGIFAYMDWLVDRLLEQKIK